MLFFCYKTQSQFPAKFSGERCLKETKSRERILLLETFSVSSVFGQWKLDQIKHSIRIKFLMKLIKLKK